MDVRAESRPVRDNRSTAVVSALVAHGLVEPRRRDEAAEVVDRALAGQAIAPGPMRRRFAELAGYVGAAFVVAAAAVFLSDQWANLATGEQVVLLVAVGLLLAAVGVGLALTGGGFQALRGGRQPVRRRLAGVLLTSAAGCFASAVTVQLEPAGSATGNPALWGALVMVVGSVAGYLVAPTVVGQLGAAGGGLVAVFSFWDLFQGGEELGIAVALLLLGVVWVVLTEARLWLEATAGRVIGCVLALGGAQFPMLGSGQEAWAYGLSFALAAGGFAAYLLRAAWPYLALGVAAVTLAAPEALLDWTDGAVGPAGVLLVAGVALLGASVLGLRLRHEVTHP